MPRRSKGQNLARRARGRRFAHLVEILESRRLLCAFPHDQIIAAPTFDWAIERREAAKVTERGGPEATSIVWANRGQASDNFAATFGASAGVARNVVDAALFDWQRIITSWNRSDGSVSLQVNVSISGNAGFGGAAAPDATAPADGKPRTGGITIGAGTITADPNDDNNWYLDPEPDDFAEFNTAVINAFAGRGNGLGSDFYSVVIAELTHVLGLVSDKNNGGGGYQGYLLENFATNTGIPDNAEGGGNGRFYVFDGPTVDHLMTGYNSGDQNAASWGNVVHTAGGAGNINFNNRNWRGAEDTGNASYSVNERTEPSWVMAHVLADAYGYSIEDPALFGTFYANLNETTNDLVVRGGAGTSADNITVEMDGAQIVVSIDVGDDVPGTGAVPGAGDLPAFVSRFNSGEIDQIVIEAGGGNDVILLNSIEGGVPVTVNAGDGDDQIFVGAGDIDGAVFSAVTFNGDAGSDTITFNDAGDAGNDSYTFTATTFAKGLPVFTYGTMERANLIANDGSNTINLNATAATTTYDIEAGNGTDTINIANGDLATVPSSLIVDGEAGTDAIVIRDTTSTAADTLTLGAGGTLDSARLGLLTYSNSESMTFNHGTGQTTLNLHAHGGLSSITANMGGGNDTVRVGNGDAGANLGSAITITANGQAGVDTIVFNDTANANAATDVVSVTSTSVDRPQFGTLAFATMEGVQVDTGTGASAVTVSSTTAPLALNTGNGNDTVTLGNLDSLAGGITFEAGAGSDSIAVNDAISADPDVYTVTFNSVTRGGFGGVSYDDLESLSVSAGSAADTININSTDTGCATTVSGGGGSDTISVASASNNLSNVRGALTIFAAAGTDGLTFYDANHVAHDAYTLTPTSLARNLLAGATYSGIESLELRAGSGNNTINVPSTVANVATSVLGGGGADTLQLASGGGGDLAAIVSAVAFDGQAGGDAVTLNDALGTGVGAYTITPTSFQRNAVALVSYANVEGLTLNATAGASVFDIDSTPGELTINGGAGADTFRVNDPPGGPVHLLGDAPTSGGGDTLELSGNAADTGTYTPDIATPGRGVVTYNAQSIDFQGLEGTGAVVLASGFGSFALVTPNSSDSVTIGAHAVADNLVTGTSGGVGFASLGISNLGQFTLDTGANDGASPNDAATIASAGYVASPAGTFRYTGGAGQDALTVQGGSLTFNSDLGAGTANLLLNVNSDNAGTAAVAFGASQRLAALVLGTGGAAQVLPNGARVLRTNSLTLNGTLDLTNNGMIVDHAGASPINTIAARLTSGYAGGAWNGAGIHSSTAAATAQRALGYGESSALFATFPAMFMGQSVDDTSVLVRYTRYGDVNLDQTVNLTDFNRLAAGFGTPGRWSAGNFNYDATVNLQDFNLLAANFGLSDADAEDERARR
jgi:hypothetical protein